MPLIVKEIVTPATPEQRRQLENTALRAGMKLSEWLRKLALDAANGGAKRNGNR